MEMICYKDKTFCSDADQCANKSDCGLYFGPEAKYDAERWWGNPNVPVAFASRKETCDLWSGPVK